MRRPVIGKSHCDHVDGCCQSASGRSAPAAADGDGGRSDDDEDDDDDDTETMNNDA